MNTVTVERMPIDSTPPHIHTLSVMTCVELLTQAGLSRRLALQNELGVGLGLFYESGKVSKESKDMLNQCYARSGYDCSETSGADYKTVNRRINATAELFRKVGFDQIRTWVGSMVERDLVFAMVQGIKPLELKSIDSVLTFVGKPRLPAIAAPKVEEEPKAGEEGGEAPKEETKVEEPPPAPDPVVQRVNTAHTKLEIHEGATREELMDLVAKLLRLAKKFE